MLEVYRDEKILHIQGLIAKADISNLETSQAGEVCYDDKNNKSNRLSRSPAQGLLLGFPCCHDKLVMRGLVVGEVGLTGHVKHCATSSCLKKFRALLLRVADFIVIHHLINARC